MPFVLPNVSHIGRVIYPTTPFGWLVGWLVGEACTCVGSMFYAHVLRFMCVCENVNPDLAGIHWWHQCLAQPDVAATKLLSVNHTF